MEYLEWMSSSSTAAASTGTTATTTTAEIPRWYMKADYVETCNCDYGCPCNFTGFPTYGFCRSLIFFHIREGNFGDNVKLDGLEVIDAVSWPKAIHEGNGTMQLFITKNADEEQRQALVKIFTGQAKGDGPFALFAPTYKYVLEPQFVDIKAKVDGKKSSFSVPDGVIDVQVENFVNPVSGEEQDTKIQLPKGFIFKVADAAKTKVMRILTPNLNFDDSGQNAFYSVVEFKGP
jgi:hypothetical protein